MAICKYLQIDQIGGKGHAKMAQGMPKLVCTIMYYIYIYDYISLGLQPPPEKMVGVGLGGLTIF